MKYILAISLLLSTIVTTTAQVGVISERFVDSLVMLSNQDSFYHIEQTRLAEKALELANAIDYNRGIYDANASMGRINMSLGQYEKGILLYQKTLKLAIEMDSLELQAHSKYCLGNIYQKLKQFNNALNHFEESLLIYKSRGNQRWVGILENGMGVVYLQIGKIEKGVEHLSSALNIFTENGLERETGIPISNLAEQYYQDEQYEIAQQYYQKSWNIAIKFNDVKGEAIGLANMGLVMKKLKQFDQSIAYTKRGLAIAEEWQFNKLIVDFRKDLAETFEEIGDYESSVAYYQAYNELSDSIMNDGVKQEVDALQKAYERERQEKELSAQKQEIVTLKQQKQLSLFANIGILLLVLFGSGFLWLFFSRNKARRQLMEVDLKNKELEKERLEKELSFKNQDLTNFALDISRKNDFAQKLHDRLEMLMDSKPEEIKEKARKLYFLVGNHLKINDDFKEFQMNIEKVNYDFFNKLDQKFPDLTVNEKQLCGLIRLNLSTKDIAAIKNISPKSVEMGRYRLRKKMQLDPKVEMSLFMQKL